MIATHNGDGSYTIHNPATGETYVLSRAAVELAMQAPSTAEQQTKLDFAQQQFAGQMEMGQRSKGETTVQAFGGGRVGADYRFLHPQHGSPVALADIDEDTVVERRGLGQDRLGSLLQTGAAVRGPDGQITLLGDPA